MRRFLPILHASTPYGREAYCNGKFLERRIEEPSPDVVPQRPPRITIRIHDVWPFDFRPVETRRTCASPPATASLRASVWVGGSCVCRSACGGWIVRRLSRHPDSPDL